MDKVNQINETIDNYNTHENDREQAHDLNQTNKSGVSNMSTSVKRHQKSLKMVIEICKFFYK